MTIGDFINSGFSFMFDIIFGFLGWIFNLSIWWIIIILILFFIAIIKNANRQYNIDKKAKEIINRDE
jgi:uncharacterized membrane protein